MKLYKNNKYFVPPLYSDEWAIFKKDYHYYEHSEAVYYLAYIDNKVVGRISGILQKASNEKWNQKAIRFTRFDFIDNYEVSQALIDEVIKWGKENSFTTVMGPIGFHDMDHEGMLVEGFEELNMSITFYNHPYYIKHMERLGFVKDIDWVEYQLKVTNEIDEKFERISNRLLEHNGYSLVTYHKRKDLLNDAYEAFKVIDVAFSKLYGTVPLTDEVVKKAIADYITIVNLKYICSIMQHFQTLLDGINFLNRIYYIVYGGQADDKQLLLLWGVFAKRVLFSCCKAGVFSGEKLCFKGIFSFSEAEAF